MNTVPELRAELLRLKEAFDSATFDRGFNHAQRLARWQTFLAEIAPLSRRLERAEKIQARLMSRDATRRAQPAQGSAAML